MKRELTITIEGARRQGKTTLAKLLAAFLKKYNYDVNVKDYRLSQEEALTEGIKLLDAANEFKISYLTIKTKDTPEIGL